VSEDILNGFAVRCAASDLASQRHQQVVAVVPVGGQAVLRLFPSMAKEFWSFFTGIINLS